MAKRVIWSLNASEDKIQLFTYWNNRNKSKTYSRKLNVLFKESVKLIQDYPSIGRKSNFDHTKKLIVNHFSIFYEETETYITILGVWDDRQDPDKLKDKFK